MIVDGATRVLRASAAVMMLAVAVAFAEPVTAVGPATAQTLDPDVAAPLVEGGIVDIASGWAHVCAIDAAQHVSCWGLNLAGQSVPPPGEFIELGAGGYVTGGYTCGLRTDQTIECWGGSVPPAVPPTGTFKTVGDGDTPCAIRTDDTVTCWGVSGPRLDTPAGAYTKVTSGLQHACALAVGGAVACWGENDKGQLDVPGDTFVDLAAGWFHTCGITDAGTVSCWGGDNDGAQIVVPPGVFDHVRAGSSSTCVWADGSTPVCWGVFDAAPILSYAPNVVFTDIEFGDGGWCGVTAAEGAMLCLGSGTFQQGRAPIVGVAEVSGSAESSCVLLADASARCFGPGGGPGPYQRVSPGMTNACALGATGTLECWGNGFFGQSDPPGGTFTELSMGFYHGCAIDPAGTIHCWGQNNFGQTNAPPGAYTSVAAGDRGSCAIDLLAALHCWGQNRFGELVPPVGQFRQVALGEAHGCAIRLDQSIACWGRNSVGQASPPSGTFVDLAVGGDASCAIDTTSHLVCWGTTSNPVNETGEFIDVAVIGRSDVCGVRTSTQLQCWGRVAASLGPPVALATPTVPDRPVNLTATPGNSSVQVNWWRPWSGGYWITDYVVQYRTLSSETWVTAMDGVSESPSAFVGGLAPDTYVFRVAAINGLGPGSYSDQSAPVVVTLADSIPPIVVGSPDGGWFNQPVTVNWTATDPDPSAGPPTDPADTIVSAQGADQIVTSEPSCDTAGNCATGTVTLSLDFEQPVVQLVGVADGATYEYGETPTAQCVSSDTLSGVANQASLNTTGGNPDGSGTFVATCSGAIDIAGNVAAPTAVTYTVAPYNTCNGLTATIVGTQGADTLTGTSGSDVIVGGGGNDAIDGNGGNDVICGGPGDDTIAGSGGEDTIRGGSGDDRIRGGSDPDIISGQDGDDIIDGDGGNDVLLGGTGIDTLNGGAGADQIDGQDGDDAIDGDGGNDVLLGGTGIDTLNGGAGADQIDGQDGDDAIDGGPGTDTCLSAITYISCEI